VANVTLWYRFSADNTTWGSWTAFGIVEVSPWQWNFAFPHGDGYYEFYSISNDTAGNMELKPGSADARCAYDATAPGADAGSDMAAVEGSIVVFNASASTDNIGMNYDYPDGSYARRREIVREHETYQKGLLYFIANDPRVPASEAEQIVREVRRSGNKVWFMMAGDEGHGFQKKTNRDVMGQAVSLFWERHLIGGR